MQRNTLGLVHEFLRRHVKEGDFCIDATAGRGRDTALLCRLTGERGTVLAFDIQREAVEETRALLEREGLSHIARVVLDSHAHMERYAQPENSRLNSFRDTRRPMCCSKPCIYKAIGTPVWMSDFLPIKNF